ncbi:MAG: hypothetical protein QM526_02080 [Alphaproteobacteria bacterium]|nr:hypothetical protein [Alphaproteobacteria bacterium]
MGLLSNIKNAVHGAANSAKQGATKMLLKKQLASLPANQQQIIMKAIETHPEFFEKITKEIETLKSQGQNEFLASITVMKKYQGELQKILSQGL